MPALDPTAHPTPIVAAVVLSRCAFNEEHDHSIRAMISTAARSHWPSDIPIADTAAAGLPRGCVVRWKLFTLPNPVILRRAGALAKNDYGTVLATARTIIF